MSPEAELRHGRTRVTCRFQLEADGQRALCCSRPVRSMSPPNGPGVELFGTSLVPERPP